MHYLQSDLDGRLLEERIILGPDARAVSLAQGQQTP